MRQRAPATKESTGVPERRRRRSLSLTGHFCGVHRRRVSPGLSHPARQMITRSANWIAVLTGCHANDETRKRGRVNSARFESGCNNARVHRKHSMCRAGPHAPFRCDSFTHSRKHSSHTASGLRERAHTDFHVHPPPAPPFSPAAARGRLAALRVVHPLSRPTSHHGRSRREDAGLQHQQGGDGARLRCK